MMKQYKILKLDCKAKYDFTIERTHSTLNDLAEKGWVVQSTLKGGADRDSDDYVIFVMVRDAALANVE